MNVNDTARMASKDGLPELKLAMTMPNSYHIQRWARMVRKMREGQDVNREKDEEIECVVPCSEGFVSLLYLSKITLPFDGS